MLLPLFATVALGLACSPPPQEGEAGSAAREQESGSLRPSVETLLARFDEAWPADRKDYRTPEDVSWKTYGLTWKALVLAEDGAAVRAGLKHENPQVRALCARALGPRGEAESIPVLVEAMKTDEWPTVRLLAVDSLGMLGGDEAVAAMKAARSGEKNGDVLLHLDTELSRKKGSPREAVLAAVKELDELDFDTAVVGDIAPDFDLVDAEGESCALSDYEGEQHLVIVFLYGDG